MKTILFSLIILIISAFTISQEDNRVIRGKVTDDQGAPVAGASISVKNSNRGTIADYNGEYSISVLPGDKTLVFSFSGFQTREVSIGNQAVINVSLKAEVIKREELELRDI